MVTSGHNRSHWSQLVTLVNPVRSGHTWLHLVTPGHNWSHLVTGLTTSGQLCKIWSHLVTSGHPGHTWSQLVTSGHTCYNWSHLVPPVTSGHTWWPMTLACENNFCNIGQMTEEHKRRERRRWNWQLLYLRLLRTQVKINFHLWLPGWKPSEVKQGYNGAEDDDDALPC